MASLHSGAATGIHTFDSLSAAFPDKTALSLTSFAYAIFFNPPQLINCRCRLSAVINLLNEFPGADGGDASVYFWPAIACARHE